jgi:P27 family predicted phage terminase small subunit
MARPGRPNKSTEQHKRDGTLGTRQKAKTPLLVGGRKRPRAPKEFLKGSNSRYAFNALVKDLWDGGILDKGDKAIIVAAAMLYDQAMQAQECIELLGYAYKETRGARDGKKGYKTVVVNPAVREQRAALVEYTKICDALGVGPSARARLANSGIKGKTPAQEIAGLGTARQLRAV